MDKHSYNISLKWNEGRKGIMESPELPTKIEVATPPNLIKAFPEFGRLNIYIPLRC